MTDNKTFKETKRLIDRKYKLESWLLSHGLDHPDRYQNLIDLKDVKNKIEQLNAKETTDAKQVTHWLNRRNNLELWLNKNSSDHPDWDQNLRDLNIAKYKVEQMQEREHRTPVNVTETYTLPRKY